MFLSGCAGIVLLSTLDNAFVSTAGAVVPGNDGDSIVRLGVVILSVVFSGVFFKKASKGINLFLSIILVFLLAIMFWQQLPYLVGASWLLDTVDTQYWRQVNDYQTLVVASGLLLSLFAVMSKVKHKKSHKDKD